MSATDLNHKIKELRELRHMAEELADEMEAITDSLKAEMAAREVDELAGTDWKITWKLVKTRRFDSRAFKAAHEKLYDQYCSESATRRFTLT